LYSEFKIVLEVAMHWTKGISPYNGHSFQPMKIRFDKIPQNDIEEMDELIVDTKAKLNCLNIDPNAPQV